MVDTRAIPPGPPAPPRCDYGCDPIRGYRAGCRKHDPVMRETIKFEAELRARAYWRSGADEDYTVKITRAERDALADAVDLIRRFRQWDHLDVAGDGPFWKREIDAALRRLDGPPEQKETRP